MERVEPAKAEAELDHLGEEIRDARRHLNERTHQEEREPYLFEDDQEPEQDLDEPNAPG